MQRKYRKEDKGTRQRDEKRGWRKQKDEIKKSENEGRTCPGFMSPLSIFHHSLSHVLLSFPVAPRLAPDAVKTGHFSGDSAVLQMGSKRDCSACAFLFLVSYCVFMTLFQLIFNYWKDNRFRATDLESVLQAYPRGLSFHWSTFP